MPTVTAGPLFPADTSLSARIAFARPILRNLAQREYEQINEQHASARALFCRIVDETNITVSQRLKVRAYCEALVDALDNFAREHLALTFGQRGDDFGFWELDADQLRPICAACGEVIDLQESCGGLCPDCYVEDEEE